MIQRKQSLFLLVAALVNACLLLVPFYRWHEAADPATLHELRLNTFFPAFIVAIVIIVMPLVAIFMFRKRKQQMAMCAFTLFSIVTFVTMMLSKVGSVVPPTVTDGTYWVGAALPVISFVFVVLAIMGIRKDDKLVKSMDRLR